MSLGHGSSIIRDGLVLHLDAANVKSYPGSGTTWFDLSGNGNNVSLINGPTHTINNKGSFIFDGTNQYLSEVSFTHSGIITAIFIAKYDTKTAYHNFFDNQTSDPMFWIQPDDQLELNKSDGAVTTNTFTNQIHVYSTISESAGRSIIYIDDSLEILDTSGADGFSNPVNLDLLNRNNGQNYKGEIFAILMYNRELLSLEIQQNFEALRGRYAI